MTMRAACGMVLVMWCALCGELAAQHVIALRGADTRYRFADWNIAFSNSAVIDLFYVGVLLRINPIGVNL